MSQAETSPRLRAALFRHDNDYGFDVASDCIAEDPLSISCVMPYYESGSIATQAAHLIAQSLAAYKAHFTSAVKPPRTELVVVDDGSTAVPFTDRAGQLGPIQIIKHPTNLGRTAARNTGLHASSDFDIVLFIDSDMMVPSNLVTEVARLAAMSLRRGQSFIIPSFFSTWRAPTNATLLNQRLGNISIDEDWRSFCVYNPTWIGTPGDFQYVGQAFRLLKQTRNFRNWSGMMGPWALPNMILGGCFALDASSAIASGSFDESFAEYGFTETSLPTRMIASGSMVVPQIRARAAHVEKNPTHYSQSTRNALFRRAHAKYFLDFLAGSE